MRNLLRCMYSDAYYATCVSYPDTLLHLAEWNSTVQEIYNLCAQVWLDGKRESHCSHGGYYVTTTTSPWGFQRWQFNGQWSLKNLNAWWNKAVRSWAEVLSSTNSFEQTCIVNFKLRKNEGNVQWPVFQQYILFQANAFSLTNVICSKHFSLNETTFDLI